MSFQYSRDKLKVSVASICQTIGWHSINSTPLEIMTDILARYISQLAKLTHDYANEFGYCEPNLDHVALVFRDKHVNIQDLEEYITYVDSIYSCPPVPEYPVQRESHLNFLKPGSKEVVTRPVYIHEHLPPMYPDVENENNTSPSVKLEETEATSENIKEENYFKRPAEISANEGPSLIKRPRLLMEEEGRPTREISSVMMTTSGFLSPAREGKLPEARTPLPTHDNPPIINRPTPPPPIQPQLPQPQPPVSVPPPVIEPPLFSDKPNKPIKVTKKIERKKERIPKDVSKTLNADGVPIEKVVKPKRPTNKEGKMKSMKAAANNNASGADVKVANPLLNSKNVNVENKIHKTLAAARMKTEKFNTTITPIPPLKADAVVDGKLSSEPDKNKLNIFKKISNVKNEKTEKLIEKMVLKVKDEIKQESRESSPDLVIDESLPPMHQKRSQNVDVVSIQLVNSQVSKPMDYPAETFKAEKSFLEDYSSPPGSPSIPKTPEMVTQSPPLALGKEKRKRKDKTKIKKVKVPKVTGSPRCNILFDPDMEKPKTPEPEQVSITPTLPFPFFPTFPGGPGLIPPQLTMNKGLFANLPFNPNMARPNFGQPPHLQPPMHFMPPAIAKEDPIEKVQDTATPISPAVEPPTNLPLTLNISPKPEKKNKEHKKEKKDKIKKKNKKDKIKNKSEKRKLKEEKKEKVKIKKEKKEKRKEKELAAAARENEVAVPKLTLKLGSASPRPLTPDPHISRKILIKPVVKKEEEAHSAVDNKRELSPELAKISALVKGHPKPKAPTVTNDHPPSSSFHTKFKKSMFKPIPKIRPKEEVEEAAGSYIEPSPGPTRAPPGPGRPRIHPQKQTKTRPAAITDNDGNKVWICPACRGQDDGSPMIGCDDCDDWYHWVCVGIQVPPDDSEDWYCRVCIGKKQETLQSDKKKKRKKKEKKEPGFE